MPRVNLTAKGIPALPMPEAGRTDYFDLTLPGFGLRVSAPSARFPKGHRTWFVFYRSGGEQKRLKLGLWKPDRTGTDLADARTAAREALRAASKGRDPAQERDERRRADTVRALSERYIREYAKPRKRTWKADENILKRSVHPAIGSKKVTGVTRGDIRDMLRTIKERAPIQANRTLEVVRKMFNWAIGEEIGGVEYNPCDHIPKPSAENKRDRVLSDDEIRSIWAALPAIHPVAAGIYRFIFYTAARVGEVANVPCEELAEPKWWSLPAARSKNKLAHRVPLTAGALDVLAEMEKHNKKSNWIFPAPGGGPFRWIYRKEHRALLEAAGVAYFSPHDIRRTVASRLGSMGTPRLVIAKVLNHAERGVTAVYDRHGYDTEKRAALEAWERELAGILVGNQHREDATIRSIEAEAQ
jgi:integrase